MVNREARTAIVNVINEFLEGKITNNKAADKLVDCLAIGSGEDDFIGAVEIYNTIRNHK
jgi:hypothetical protein